MGHTDILACEQRWKQKLGTGDGCLGDHGLNLN